MGGPVECGLVIGHGWDWGWVEVRVRLKKFYSTAPLFILSLKGNEATGGFNRTGHNP